MTRRPSTVSVASLGSSKAPLDSLWTPGAASAHLSSPIAAKLPYTVSQNGGLASSKTQNDVADVDPDELFTKYTIAEVKTRQAQLRADAEAKQEDLRVMVGERYRDLLHASSSIISISTSAKRVREALEETRTAIKSQRVPSVQNHVSQSGKDDSHLQMLQVLSAHIKLLLDAPEHLWRLIEREKYFQAAWLFLLARVVHRALIRDDAQDDESWIHHGIDVIEQFPLIQRQWETVSHFRTQIIHRATLSLRLHDKPSEDTCATLLTLHILDSRPLTETLTIYLSQRTRSLNALLAKGLDIPEQHNGSIPVVQLNGRLPEAHASTKPTKLPAKTLALAVKTSTQTTLEAISRTLCTAREVFGTSSSAQSLARRVLDSIQTESSSAPSSGLPPELLLSTQAVLNALPSSTYVSLLPANIRSYRPFVDLSSTSSSLSQELLGDKLSNWFEQSTASLRAAFDKWFAPLNAVSAVWKVRSSLRKWVVHTGVQASELAHLTRLLDEASSMRITDIWKAALAGAEKGFVQALASLGSGNVEDLFSPLCSLYRPAPAPQPSSGSPSFDNSFRTYRTTMSQRLGGRTPLLHKTLGTLEDAASSLQSDLAIMSAEGDSSQRLITELTAAYQPAAQTLCQSVVSTLTDFVDELMANPDAMMHKLVFRAHVANELSSSSSFVQNIGCDQPTVIGFRVKLRGLFERIMICWEEHVISGLVSNYIQHVEMWSTYSGSVYAHPSPPMMECLYSLSSSIHNLGMSHYQSHLMVIAQTMIAKFSAALVDAVEDGDSLDDAQLLHDLTFLQHIASKWQDLETTKLEKAIEQVRSHLPGSSEHDPNRSAFEWLSRTQMLVSALLPPPAVHEETVKENGDKAPAALAYGVPVVDSQFVPAVELAPPSLRFPLLLVDAR